MLGKDNPQRPKNDVDPQAWWREAAKTIRFYPVLVSDGKTSYRFKVEVTPKRLTTKNLKVLKYEIESVAPDYIAIPTNDGGPTAQLLPEYVGRPPLGIPAEGRHVSVDPLPIKGPQNTILVAVQDTGRKSTARRGRGLIHGGDTWQSGTNWKLDGTPEETLKTKSRSSNRWHSPRAASCTHDWCARR